MTHKEKKTGLFWLFGTVLLAAFSWLIFKLVDLVADDYLKKSWESVKGNVTTFLTENFVWVLLGFLLVVIVAIVVSIAVRYKILPRIRKWQNVPWTKASRPRHFNFWNGNRKIIFGEEKESFVGEEYYGVEKPDVDKVCMEDYIKSEKPTLFFCLEDDACGLKVATTVPFQLSFNEDELKQRRFTENLVRRATSMNGNHQMGAIAVASRMTDKETAAKRFGDISDFLVNAWIENGFDGETRWAIRTDSCLRVHYAEETNAIVSAMNDKTGGDSFDLDIFVPANVKEGRITNFGVQYFREKNAQGKESYIPMHESEYGEGYVGFEFRDSNLARFLENKCKDAEKGQWKVRKGNVHLVDIFTLRTLTVDEIVKRIKDDPELAVKNGAAVVFDAEEIEDLEKVLCVTRVLEKDKKLLYHAGTSFTAMLSGNHGQKEVDLEEINQLFKNIKGPGITIAGSRTNRTDNQTKILTQEDHAYEPSHGIGREDIVNPKTKKDSEKRGTTLEKLVKGTLTLLSENKHVLVKTRQPLKNDKEGYGDCESRERIGGFFAEYLKSLSQGGMESFPGWILLKGSDTAIQCLTQGLGIYEMELIGTCEFAQGVFVCRSENFDLPDATDEVRNAWRNMPIFLCAGNSGDESALDNLVRGLRQLSGQNDEKSEAKNRPVVEAKNGE